MAKALQVVAQAVGFALVLASPALAAGVPSSAVVIDELEFQGVTALSQKDLETRLDIGPGDTLERLKVFRTAENLKKAYLERGYEQVTIQSRVYRRAGKESKTVLEFTLSEGNPTRVAHIHFLPGELKTSAARREWEAKVDRLGARFGLSPGDTYDRGRIDAGRRAIAELLTSDETIGAKVQEVRTTESAMPTEYKSVPAARWVDLEVVVDIGEHVSFGFRGQKILSGTYLIGLVEAQRSLGLGKSYITDIQARLLEEYRSLGFGLVQIEPLTFEFTGDRGRHVTYVIQEGPRVTLDAIVFDGHSVFTEAQLRSQFLSRAAISIQNGYYVEADIEKAAGLLVEWMRSQGYLAAKLVAVHSNFIAEKRERKDRARVRAVVYLYEGDRTTVERLVITGNHAMNEAKIAETLNVAEGAPLNLFAFTEGLEALKASYREQGYLGIKILNEATNQVVLYGNENRTAVIELHLEEGPQYRVSQILIEGNTTTFAEVIRREIELQPEDVLAESHINAIETRLRRLGIFSGVSVRLADDPEKPQHKIVRVIVQEADRGIYDYGIGGRNDLGLRLFGSIGYTNLLGRNYSLTLRGNVNRRFINVNEQMLRNPNSEIPIEYNAQLAYLWPWFYWHDTTFRPTLTVSNTQYKTFNAAKASAAMTWEKKLYKPLGLTAFLTGSWEFVSQTQAKEALDLQDLTIGGITPTLEMDLRDNPLAPTRGFYAEGSLEFAAPFLGSSGSKGSVGYYRVQLRGDYHRPLPLGLGLYLSFRTGFERNNEPGSTIPLIKQFSLGGAGSLRGFAPQEINVSSAGVQGTSSFVNYRAQIDLPFAGALKIGPFLDVANLLVDSVPYWASYYFSDIYVGAGFGFHYQTPIGPLNLDWGFKLKGPAGSDPFRIDFSIGVI